MNSPILKSTSSFLETEKALLPFCQVALKRSQHPWSAHKSWPTHPEKNGTSVGTIPNYGKK